MWRKERGKRERCRCFVKQPSHELKFKTMRQLYTPLYKWLLSCSSQIFLCCIHKLRALELLWDNIKDNTLYLLSLKSSHNYVALLETIYVTIPIHLSSRYENQENLTKHPTEIDSSFHHWRHSDREIKLAIIFSVPRGCSTDNTTTRWPCRDSKHALK
jgi:hypothetical protein